MWKIISAPRDLDLTSDAGAARGMETRGVTFTSQTIRDLIMLYSPTIFPLIPVHAA